MDVLHNSSLKYPCRQADYFFIDVSAFRGTGLLDLLDNIKRNENPYYYPVAVYFTSLVPQLIREMADYELMKDFHRCSTWPLISCGLGGVMDPIHTLWEAGLMPSKGCDVNLLIQTIREAESVIEKDIVEFIQGGQKNANPSAYNRLKNRLSYRTDEFKNRMQAAVDYFINWINEPVLNKNPKSFSIADVALEKYLETLQEVCPEWLLHHQKGDKVNLQELFRGRVLFYPGSGTDGQPIKFFNQHHIVHLYLYVDYLLERERLEQILSESPFKGYHLVDRVELAADDFAPWGVEQHIDFMTKIKCMNSSYWRNKVSPYSFMDIYERDTKYDNTYGAIRFAVIFLYADAFVAYDAIFCNSHLRQPPFIMVLQDHGFGGNYDKFGRGGLLNKIADITQIYPPYMMVTTDDSTKHWSNYQQISHMPEYGGMYHSERHLFKLNLNFVPKVHRTARIDRLNDKC